MSAVPDLIDRLRDAGWRLTSQRRVIAESLHGDHVHLTAEEVWQRARRTLPELTKATVYNTLNELVAMGQVHVVNVDGRRRYDPNVEVAHDHLVCDRCGRVRDVTPSDAPIVNLPRQRQGFRVTSVEIVFRGLCSPCRHAR